MLILIIGAAGSGKSIVAEKISFALKKKTLYYIATMKIWDRECEIRVQKHRRQRADKGFDTIECATNLLGRENLFVTNQTALLDCLGNLLANEMFEDNNKNAVCDILDGVLKISDRLDNLVIVSNDIFEDGIKYTKETMEYINNLGLVNKKIAQSADIVIEVCCGIEIIHKGADKYNEINI